MELRLLTASELAIAYDTDLREAFPPSELKPLSAMENLRSRGLYDPLCLFDDDGSAMGYILLWKHLDGRYLLIDYLCVPARRRNGGIGAKLIRMAIDRYPVGTVIIAESEAPTGDPERDGIILRRLGKIDQEGSAYNLLGLLFPVAWQPNQMFCSQFVYRMLRLAGLHYFRKDPFQVRPMDFVDLDAQGALTLVAAYTRVGGRLLAREARPLPAGWQASA